MDRKREYYYRTPSPYDYTYSDYLEYCDVMGNVKWQFADMICDMIGKKDMDINDIFDMYFYIKSNAVGWRRVSAHSKPTKVENVIDLMGNAYEYIEFYVDIDSDGYRDYTLMMSGHDSTDYFDIVPFHEDFIVEIMDDMGNYMPIDDIVSHIGYYDFINMKNMIAMIENIGDYDVEDMEFVINNLVDGVDNMMLMELLHKGE